MCGLQSSGQKKFKIAHGKIDWIIARGRLDCAKGCDKKKMVRNDKINIVVVRGSKAHDHAAVKKCLQWKGCNRTRG